MDSHHGFWVAHRSNEASKLWGRRYDEDRFQYNRSGDMLLTPFQCEWCWFINLKEGYPVPRAGGDVKLLKFIRRANLDALWSREKSTVKSNLGQERKASKMRKNLGLPSPNYPDRGPWPLGDSVGMTTCLVLLEASVQPGVHSKSHQQYDTIRKLRSVYTSLHESSVWAEGHSLVFTGEKGRKYRTAHGEAESTFYKLFNQGLEKRMDRDVRSNLGLELGLLLRILHNLELEASIGVTPRWRRRFLIMVGGYLVISYAGSLRGNEGLFVEAKGTIRQIGEGVHHPEYPHVCVTLFGRFKGENNEASSTLVLANRSKGGLEIRKWVERLVGVLHLEGAMKREGNFVPGICNPDGSLMSREKLNEEFWKQLERIQKENGNALDKSIKIRQKFGIHRSLRRGSRTRAEYQGVPREIIELVNRWNKFEMSQGRPSLSMYEHYAEMKQLLNIFSIYSASL